MISARIQKKFEAGSDSASFVLDIEFQTKAGVAALFGPSGAGKTLTLDAIAGFVKPDQGRILIDDRILFDAGAKVCVPPRLRRCGYVFQNYALFPHMTLLENLEFAAARRPRIERRRRTAEMLDRFRLTELSGRRPHELSGGQQQRCSVARALITEPNLLLLDEPARGLDAQLRSELYDVLRQVRRDFSTPVLLVTHSLDECFELADELFVIHGGRIAQSGTPAEIAENPATLEVARLLGAHNILAAEIRALDPSRDTSVLRVGQHDIAGRYYPGFFKGDRVHLLAPVHAVKATPWDERRNGNPFPASLIRTVSKPDRIRLEFEGNLAAELPLAEWEPRKDNKEWAIEIPARSLRIL